MEKGWISQEFMVKAYKTRNLSIKGYASVYDVTDLHGDVIRKGAFKNANAEDVRLLWQHESKSPIGIINLLKEDEYGLQIQGEVNINTALGKEVAELVKQGAVAGLSVGFSVKSSDYDKEGVRIITDADLMEVSIVTFPANKEAEIKEVKSDTSKSESSVEEEHALGRLESLIEKL